MKALCWEVLIW